MEDVVLTCPHIGVNIFECLDFKSLVTCKNVCKTLRLFRENPAERICWIKKIATTFVVDSDGVIGQLKGITRPTLEFLAEEAGKIPFIKTELFHLLHFLHQLEMWKPIEKCFFNQMKKTHCLGKGLAHFTWLQNMANLRCAILLLTMLWIKIQKVKSESLHYM